MNDVNPFTPFFSVVVCEVSLLLQWRIELCIGAEFPLFSMLSLLSFPPSPELTLNIALLTLWAAPCSE
jgi:hypothetical protein